jgi:FkbM family methyltransferase
MQNILTFIRKVRVALTPRNWLLKSKLGNGAVVCGRNRPGFGGRGVYIFRDALEPELEHIEKLLEPAGVFLDVGANTGIYSLKAAKFLGGQGGIVIAVEPFPDMLATLNHNIRLNGFNNVRLRSFCLGEKTGPADLWMNFQRPASFSTVRRDETAARLSTMTVTLDEIFPWENLNRLDYVKIDVEGAEQQVLAGGRRTFAQYRPIVQMEVNISDARLNLPDYTVFQAPDSPNKVCIPNESSKVEVPGQLGWSKIG